MAGISAVGATKGEKPEKEKQEVTIYFGVFFDGTNNHRLQVLKGKIYREKHKSGHTHSEDEKEVVKNFTLDFELKDQIHKNKTNQEKEEYDSSLVGDKVDVDEIKDNSYYKINPIQNNDYTNIALLEPLYQAKEKLEATEYAYRIYVSGSGSNRDLNLNVFKILNDEIRGGALGQGETGVVQKVMDAIECINRKLTLFQKCSSIRLVFHLFGFSRGSTEARTFAHVMNIVHKKNKSEEKQEISDKDSKYWIKKIAKCKNIISKKILNVKIKQITIPVMGIYDTVASVGVLDKEHPLNAAVSLVERFSRTKSKFHQLNVNDLGQNDLELVDTVYQICALDEYRENFALIPINKSTAKNKIQVYIPGVHADVGGGYPEGFSDKIKFPKNHFYMPQIPIPYHLRDTGGEGAVSSKEEDVSYRNNVFLFSIDELEKYGWLDKNKDMFDDSDTLEFSIQRNSQKGYSYVGLRLMIDKFNNLFNFDLDKENKFSISKDQILMNVYNKARNLSMGLDADAVCLISDDDYKKLRNRYLHMSMKGDPVCLPNYITVQRTDGETVKCVSRIEYF